VPRIAAALCALLVTAGLGVASRPAAGASPTRCAAFAFKSNGTTWKANTIRVSRVGCPDARRLIRLYAKPRNCQFRPRCKVSVYSCRTLEAEGSTFTERCTRDGGRSVRWRGSYVPR